MGIWVRLLAGCLLAASVAFTSQARALPTGWERPPEPEPPAVTPRSTFVETWSPAHPASMVEASVGVSATPPGRALTLDVDVELAPGLAIGAHGLFARCSDCYFSDESYESVHDLGSAYAYAGFSRPNFMIAGTLLLLRGEGLESAFDRFSYGAGLLLRLGRVDGLRLDTGFGLVVAPAVSRWVDSGPGYVDTTPTGGAIVLHNELRVPLFGRGDYRVGLEARSEFSIIDPFFWLPSV
ncbi:MAG: hypothetical protein GXP55_12990, partial [Deltaproteobacteria bacterium]|nr:hypothetical protein [Deltaproteobacteria bacterium]